MDEESVKNLFAKLDEIIFWLKISNIQSAREQLEIILDTEQKKVAYQNSDGKGTQEIANIVGVGSNRTIANWWDEWLKYGIVSEVKSGRGSTKIRMVDLEILGLFKGS
jgi:hypothetical protein